MVTVVVLAAGESKRFGSQKLLHPLDDGDTLLGRAIRASKDFNTLVVCSDATLSYAQALGAPTVLNREPERGMAHSLRLADEAVARDRAMLVVPADLLFIEPQHMSSFAVLADDGDDVIFPIRSDGTPGHPVYFSTRARALIGELADNEPIARVRDDVTLTRRSIAIEELWPYRDVDRPEDL